MPGDASNDISGDRIEALEGWLRERRSLRGRLDLREVTGGRSNVTYVIYDGGEKKWVLRTPPSNSPVPSAHDVTREAKVIRALEESGLPVPEVVGWEPDPAVWGAPFFVMEFVDGTVVNSERAAEEELTPEARAHSGLAVAHLLADLHALNPSNVGLGQLGRGHSFARRQLDLWLTNVESAPSVLPDHHATIAKLHSRLMLRVPEQQQTTIVHGDYRIENMILDPSTGEVRALLDWELSTRGDPRVDLGMLFVYWSETGDSVRPFVEAPTTVAGFVGRKDMLDAYTERVGSEVPNLSYFVSLAYWRLACILHGVYQRFQSGSYEEVGNEFSDLARSIPELLDESDRLLNGAEDVDRLLR